MVGVSLICDEGNYKIRNKTKGVIKMELTPKQQKFVQTYIDTNNATEAIVQSYDVKDRVVAKSMGSENLAKPCVAQAIAIKKASIAESLEEESMLLLNQMLDIAKNSQSDAIRLKACIDLLDRAGYSAKKNISLSGGETAIQIETRHTSDLAKRARELILENNKGEMPIV